MAALTLTANGQGFDWLPFGDGDWDTTTDNWDAPGGVITATNWVQGEAANFSLPGGGTVTVTEPIDVTGINFFNGAWTITGGELSTSVGDLNIEVSGPTANIDSIISGNGGVDLGHGGSTGNLRLRGANTYTGITHVHQNTLIIFHDTALGTTDSGTVVFGGGSLSVLGGLTLAEELQLSGLGGPGFVGALHFFSGGGAGGDTNINGDISLTGGGDVRITAVGSTDHTHTIAGSIDGTGTEHLRFAVDHGGFPGNTELRVTGNIGAGVTDLNLDGASAGLLTLAGTNAYTGDTNIDGGELRVEGGAAITDTSAVIISSGGATPGVLTVANDETIGSLAGDPGAGVTLLGTLTTGFNDLSRDFAGTISGPGGLTKIGTGTQTLSGPNTYGGVTNINAGVVKATNGSSLGATGSGLLVDGTIVADGGTLELSNTPLFEDIQLTGAGAPGQNGALQVEAGTFGDVVGSVTLVGPSTTVASAPGAFLNFFGPLDKSDTTLIANSNGGEINFNAPITGNLTGFDDDFIATGGGTVNLVAANTYLGATFINGGTTLQTFVPDALPILNGRTTLDIRDAGSTLNLIGANQAVASLNGDAGTFVDLSAGGDNVLTIGFGSGLNTNGNATADYAGSINGGPLFGGVALIKDDSSTQTLSGPNGYFGDTVVNDGVLRITNDAGLGSAVAGLDDTFINGDGQVALEGGITTAEEFHINYGGTTTTRDVALNFNADRDITTADTASILNISGSNTIDGDINIVTNPGEDLARIDSAAGLLTINGDINGNAANDIDILAFGGAGDITVTSDIGPGGSVEVLYKDGSGTLDISGPGGNGYDEGTVIADGTLRVDSAGDLGTDNRIHFIGTSTLEILTGGGDVDMTSKTFRLHNLTGPIIATVDVNGGNAVNANFGDILSDDEDNVFRKVGGGDLNLIVNPGDLTPNPLVGVSKCEQALLSPNSSLFGEEAGAILDPAQGTVTIDNSGNARTTVTAAGLGNTVDAALSTGTLNLINANFLINGTTETFFGGSIIGDGNLGIAVDTTLDGSNALFTGQIVVHNLATLTVGNDMALGSFGNVDANGTYVCAGSTLAISDLSLTGGSTISERITLFNNAELINNAGDNTIDSMLLIEHDINGNPNPSPPTAHIGAIGGSLTLTGGIEDHFTGGDMSLSINTEATELGNVIVNSVIGSSIEDLFIGSGTDGSSGNDPSVLLTANNQYSGNTFLNGGVVVVDNFNGAFSTGFVDVTGSVGLASDGATLANTFQLNAGSTLTTGNAALGLTGTIDGTGNLQVFNGTLTLSGVNTYTGTTTVNADGTLNVGTSLASTMITVDTDGVLNTTQADVLSDNTQLTANGTWNLNGGNETIRSIAGAGTIDTNIFNLGVMEGTFDGKIIGLGDVNKTTNGVLTLNGDNSFTGVLNVLDGDVNLGVGGSLATDEINISTGASLTTGEPNQLADTTVANVGGTLTIAGVETIDTVNVSGPQGKLDLKGDTIIDTLNVTNDSNVNLLTNNGSDLTVTTLNGDSSSEIDLGTDNALTVSNGTFNGMISNAHGDLNKVGGGTLNLGGNNTYTGTTHVAAGTLHLTPLGQLSATDIVEVDSGATLSLSGVGVNQINNAAALDIDGTLNLAGDETVGSVAATGTLNGPGELTAATYALTGATVNADLGTGAITSNGATAINGDANADTTTVAGGTLTVAGALTNATGDVTVQTGGTLQANGTIAADDVTVDNGGTLNTGDNERLNDSANVTLDGDLNLGGNETIGNLTDTGAGTGVLDNNGFDLTLSSGDYAGDITGAGNLNKQGAGTLNLDGGNAISYTGATNVLDGVVNLLGSSLASTVIDISNGATLTTSSANAINDLAHVNVDGTLGLGGNETFDSLTGGATGEVVLGNFDLTLTGGIDFAGRITGDGGVAAGPGDLILRGDNTFVGGLTVLNGSTVTLIGTIDGDAQVNSGGELTLESSERIIDSATVTVDTGGTMTLNGVETIAELNLGGLLRGDGQVNADTYNLTNGAETQALANLGDGVLTSKGTTLLGGNSGANTVTVIDGTMTVNGTITNPLGLEINIDSGATMALGFDERLGDNAIMNNSGFLDLNGDETITTYNADGGGLLAAGLLTAETYNLSNGAFTDSGADLGTGILNSGPGTVTLGGDAAVETVNVLSGILNQNGLLTDVLDVNISGGATMNLGSTERINDAAVVNNDGTLNLSGVETITTYNSTGTLGGNGTLIADTYNLEAGSQTNNGANLGGGVLNVGCNTAGLIVMNGDSASEDVTVCDGSTLTLGGQLTAIGTATSNPGDNLTIENNATLNLGAAADQINNDGVVINDGTVNLFGAETIGTFISSGTLGLAGGAPIPSILTTQGNTITLLGGHTSLIGTGLAGVGPNPQLTSNGVVNINGTANDTVHANNATLDVSTALIQSGTMHLDGLIIGTVNGSPDITVNNTATLISGSANRITNGATVTVDNGGTWILGSGANNGNDTITTFNAGGQLNNGGPGISTLTANTYNLTGGAQINANLGTGVLNSNDSVLNSSNTLNGDSAAGDVNVTSGTLNLNGRLTNVATVDISAFADLNIGPLADRIVDTATVNNDGELNLNGTEVVSIYNSDGSAGDGHLDGSGLLTATTYNLRDGASSDFGADIGTTGTFNSNGGTVTLGGKLDADLIEINSGTLVTNGNVGDSNLGDINIDGGARWDVNGNYRYDNVHGTGTIRPNNGGGTFTNQTNLRPGDIITAIGQIYIDGDYTESGKLHADIGTGGSSDTVRVDDYVHLAGDSVLQLNEVNGLDGGNVLCGERWNIINSYETRNGNFFNGYAISGGWSEITDDDNLGINGNTFGSRVIFDRGSGDVVALGLKAGETFADYVDIDANQLATITAVFNGSVDGVGNYNSNDGTSGSVLDAVLTNAAPGDKEGLLDAVDALSPEAYAGAVDYALHATRSYAQNVMAATPQMSGANYDIVAGWSHFNMDSDSSRNNGDYDINSNGGYLGVRVNCHPDFVFGGFLAADHGAIDGSRVNLDADGYVLGGFVEWTPEGPEGPWTVWGNLAYGNYEFDGDRRGLISELQVPDFDADAFQLGVGVDYVAYQQNEWTIIPGAGLRYIDATTDGFTETGGPDALKVGGMDQDLLLLDLAVRFIYQQASQPWAVNGSLGWQHDFSDAERDVDAMLANGGGLPFTVEAPGLGDDAFTYGVGAHYNFGERYRVGLSYRGELRDDADAFHGLDLRVTAGF